MSPELGKAIIFGVAVRRSFGAFERVRNPRRPTSVTAPRTRAKSASELQAGLVVVGPCTTARQRSPRDHREGNLDAPTLEAVRLIGRIPAGSGYTLVLSGQASDGSTSMAVGPLHGGVHATVLVGIQRSAANNDAAASRPSSRRTRLGFPIGYRGRALANTHRTHARNHELDSATAFSWQVYRAGLGAELDQRAQSVLYVHASDGEVHITSPVADGRCGKLYLQPRSSTWSSTAPTRVAGGAVARVARVAPGCRRRRRRRHGMAPGCRRVARLPPGCRRRRRWCWNDWFSTNSVLNAKSPECLSCAQLKTATLGPPRRTRP